MPANLFARTEEAIHAQRNLANTFEPGTAENLRFNAYADALATSVFLFRSQFDGKDATDIEKNTPLIQNILNDWIEGSKDSGDVSKEGTAQGFITAKQYLEENLTAVS